MWFFNSRPVETLAVATDPEIVEVPAVSADELERMVYEVYRDKLSLAEELAERDATIDQLKERADKLSAAEAFLDWLHFMGHFHEGLRYTRKEVPGWRIRGALGSSARSSSGRSCSSTTTASPSARLGRSTI